MREELEKLIAEATPGDLSTAQLSREEVIECPVCGGDGEVDAVDYCNFDHKALGVQFYGIGKEFGAHEKLWSYFMNNAPAIVEALTERASMAAEIERLRADVARLREPHWFYLGDDCSSDQCRFGIDECISEDFEWDNQPKGNHVLQISGARPVPDMWVALHYFTEEEMDQRGDDEPYTYTVHTTEEEARAALEARP